jgi:site-specific recombinase XerC
MGIHPAIASVLIDNVEPKCAHDIKGTAAINRDQQRGDKRREAGMDQFGFEQLAAWLAHRVSLPIGPLFCVIDGPTRGRRWAATAARAELRQPAAQAGVRRRFAPHQLRMRTRSNSLVKESL